MKQNWKYNYWSPEAQTKKIKTLSLNSSPMWIWIACCAVGKDRLKNNHTYILMHMYIYIGWNQKKTWASCELQRACARPTVGNEDGCVSKRERVSFRSRPFLGCSAHEHEVRRLDHGRSEQAVRAVTFKPIFKKLLKCVLEANSVSEKCVEPQHYFKVKYLHTRNLSSPK